MSETPRDLEQICRDEMGMHARILATMGDGDMTVSEVAEKLALPPSEVMVWMMGMRRYGLLAESSQPNDDDFFTYHVVEQEKEGAS